MKTYLITERKIPSQNQTKFSSGYDLANLSSIFVNGNLQTEEDYLVKNGKVIFQNELSDSDEVVFNFNLDTARSLISPGKSTNASVLGRFSSDIKLNENNKYHIGIAIDTDMYEWTFNSKQNPMFTTYKKVLEDVGEFIEGFSEEYINSKIYDNSLAVIDLIDELANQDDPVTNVTYDIDSDGIYSSTYKAVSNWVRYKTDIDLVIARYFGISYRYGTQLKQIGDIKIEKTTKLPYIDNLMGLLKRNFELADEAIRGTNVVASAVKGSTNYSYEDWDRDTTW